jgi:hypothetical protein
VVFRTWFGRRWSVAHPGTLLGNQRAGFVFAPPLPPLGFFLAGQQLPFSVSTEAVLAHVAPSVNPGWRPPQSAKLFRFDDIHSVEAKGKRVRINGEVLLKAASPALADRLAQDLAGLWKSPPAKRERAVREWVQTKFDVTAVERLWQECRLQLKAMRVAANFLLGWLFVVAPVLIWRTGLAQCWISLVVGLFGGTVVLAVQFRRAHRRFYPEAEEERFNNFLITLLSPVTAIRSHDLLTRPLLLRYHPLAVAKALCPARLFQQVAAQMLRETRYPAMPVCPCPDPVAQAAERHTRLLLLEAMEDLLKKDGLSADRLLPPPVPEEGCRAFCPRCQAQFTETTVVCQDCGGLTLVTFAEAGKAETLKR